MDRTLVLKAIADETRMKILTLLLNHNYCVRALAVIERDACMPEKGGCILSEQEKCHVKGECNEETKEFCHGKENRQLCHQSENNV